jgi:hypothetical protein
VPTTLDHLPNFRALDYLVPELGDAHLAPQNGDCLCVGPPEGGSDNRFS